MLERGRRQQVATRFYHGHDARRPRTTNEFGEVESEATSDKNEGAEKEPVPAPGVTEGIWDGIGDALHGVWNDWTTPIWEPASDIYNAYRQGDVVDAFNQVNPLIPVANISLAIDDGDTYSVTRQSVAIGVTVVGAVIVGKVASGRMSGGKTTRGPPRKANGAYHNNDLRTT